MTGLSRAIMVVVTHGVPLSIAASSNVLDGSETDAYPEVVEVGGTNCSGVRVSEHTVLSSLHCAGATTVGRVSVERANPLWPESTVGYFCVTRFGGESSGYVLADAVPGPGDSLELVGFGRHRKGERVTAEWVRNMAQNQIAVLHDAINKPRKGTTTVSAGDDGKEYVVTAPTEDAASVGCPGDSGGPHYLPGTRLLVGLNERYDSDEARDWVCGERQRVSLLVGRVEDIDSAISDCTERARMDRAVPGEPDAVEAHLRGDQADR